LGPEEAVYTAVQYLLTGSPIGRADAQRLATGLLANTLIQTVRVYAADEWRRSEPRTEPPRIREAPRADVRAYNLNVPDAELLEISRRGILSLSLEEMRAIRDHFNRPEVRAHRTAAGLSPDPTDVELECVAQSWSEHCSHKVFAATVDYTDAAGRRREIRSLYKTYIKAATRAIAERVGWLVSVFTDNAGVIRLNDRLNLVYKVETHNSPSALDPYGGAMTGIVGVNRDPMGTGMGASLLANVWGYCLGSPFYQGDLPEGLMHPRRIRDGVHQGVIEGGNQSGIPWARGFEVFDDRFLGKPLVYCGTLGIIPAVLNGRPSEEKSVRPGDRIVVVGGRTGKDGIHGATFSSEDLHEHSPAQAVQIGDPITQRKMYECLLEARDAGLYRCITDNGAGGLSCSVGEMGRMSGGADLDVALAPLKYQGLLPWEILLSEAQERMTLAVPPDHVDAFLDLCRRRDVEAAVLGTFTDSGVFQVRCGDRVVGRLDMDFLYEGCPVMTVPAVWSPPEVPGPAMPQARRLDRLLLDLLGSLAGCSREFKSRQYDGEVKGLSVVKPYVGRRSDVPSDATVMRVGYDSHEGVLLAEGINPFLSDLDPYAMMASVIDEGVRRIISAGGRLGRIAGLDNFCWPDPVLSDKTPDGPYKMGQLVRANEALYDVTVAYGVPCISGKDSTKNDSTRGGRKISIPPTVLFSTLGMTDDVRRAVTVPAKRAGDLVYVAGMTRSELGASALYRLLAEQQGRPRDYGGQAPQLDIPRALALYEAMARATAAGLFRSSHTPTRGGLAVALAMVALGGDLGIEAVLAGLPAEGSLSDAEMLFAESNSRFVITVAPERRAAVESLFVGLPLARVGQVVAEPRLRVRGQSGRMVLDCPLAKLRTAFRKTLYGL
jgi:phosphoribosylformylglycinamidine synthase